MEKIYGTKDRQDGLYKIGRNKYALIYGLYKDADGNAYEYRHTYRHKPAWTEVRDALIEAINSHTKEEILNGLVWNGKRVWLSDENQRNYMMIEQLDASAYPLKVKINEDRDGSPEYHTFSEAQFKAFSRECREHVINALAKGWEEKDSLKAEDYGY